MMLGMTENVMVNIFGSPTTGKSTIVELLQQHIDRLYTVDFDVIKHQISGYSWKRDSQVALNITYENLASAAKSDLQIAVLIPKPKDQAAYERIADIARDNGYQLINIELTAPKDVIMQRYQDRLANIADTALVRRMKNLDEFNVYVSTPYYRPEDTHTFDSAVMDPDEIFQKINELIGGALV